MRQSSTSLRGGGIGESSIQPIVTGRVSANPVDTTIAPAENNFNRLAGALEQFMPGFRQYAAEDQRRWEVEQREYAQAEANLTDISDPKAAMTAFSTDASQVAQGAFRQALGARVFSEAQQEFAQFAEANFDPNNPDPEYARSFAMEFFNKRIEGMDDPLFRGSYSEGVAKVADKFSSDHIGKIVQDHHNQKVANLTAGLSSYLQDPMRPAGWLDDLKAKNPYLDKNTIEAQSWPTAIEHAINTGDPMLLEEFNRPTADGQQGFINRGGPETLKQYLDARSRAMANFQKKIKTSMEMQEEHARTFLNEKLGRIETLEEDFTDRDLEGIYSTLDGLAGAGVFGDKYAEAVAGFKSKFYQHYLDIQRLSPVAEQVAAGKGAYSLGNLDPKEQRKVLRLVARQNPHMDPRVVAARNGLIEETDRNMLVSAAYHIATPQSSDVLPPDFEQAFNTFKFYMTLDGGARREDFLHKLEKENPEAFYMWTNVEKAWDHDPAKDAASVWQSAKILTSNRSDKLNVDPESLKKISDKAIKQIAENTPELLRIDTTGERSNSYVRTWLQDEFNMVRKLTGGNISDEAMMNGAVEKFQATHVLVGKSWINVANLKNRPSKDEADLWGESLQRYVQEIFIRDRGDITYGWDAERLGDMEVSLRPIPMTHTDRGDPLYRMFVNGRPLAEEIDIRQLAGQYRNRTAINTETLQVADEVMQRLETGFEKPEDYTPEMEQHDRAMINVSEEMGLYTSDQAKKLSRRVDDFVKRREGQRIESEEKDRAWARESVPIIKAMAEKPDPELLVKAKPANDLMDPKMGNIHSYVREKAQGDKPQYALGALVFGRSGMMYEQEGEQRIGFGYRVGDNSDAEFRKGMRSAIGHMGFDVLLKGIREGRGRLDPYQTEKLWDFQLKSAQKQITDVMGANEFALAPAGMQYGLSTLVTTLGNPQDTPAVLEKIKAGDFTGVLPMMTRVPEGNRESALAYIRAMMAGTSQFKALVENRSPDK